jgi:DnaJ homolog subfamily C member 28
MSDPTTSRSNVPRSPTGPHGPGQPQGDLLRRWRSAVEEQLAEAAARGDFDNLRGTGQPLALDVNPYAGDRALGYSLLKSNNLAPPEIERGKEIDADLGRVEALLTALRQRRDALRLHLGPTFAAERRAYMILRDKTEARYAEALRAVNSKILSLNIIAPAVLHRRTLDIEQRQRAFADEFPRLD